jgi:hypothetical protein
VIATTFPTNAALISLHMANRRARCTIDGRRFRFGVWLSYKPNGAALTMERFAALVRLATAHPTTAEGIADWLRAQVALEMPHATGIAVTVFHHPNRDGVTVEVVA